MKLKDESILDLLIKENYISIDDSKKALEYAKQTHRSSTDYLLLNGIVTKNLLGQAIAEAYKIHYIDLESEKPSKEIVTKIPEEIAIKNRVILANIKDHMAVVATDSPEQKDLLITLKQTLPDYQIDLRYATSEDIDKTLVNYKKTLNTRFAQIISEQTRVAPEIIEEIIKDAISFRASDIHFEPQISEVVIRFRIDGALHEAGRINKQYYDNILNRVKVQAHLRIDEHFAAQDGAIRLLINGTQIDMRVSIVPILDGETIVIRLLSEYAKSLNLQDLGLTEEMQRILISAAKKPVGMIMTTGPTGSGKTTTLYALLKLINNPEINITTIEDPVEYKVIGVNQIQVNPETDLTFSHGLRSIVRQDPDAILVGEIRDEETAELAVNAALTGHLLLSTFHANDAATSIPRLLDMGIEPFLLASTLNVIIAQRLVRKIHSVCRVSQHVSTTDLIKAHPELKGKIQDAKTVQLFRGKGCNGCNFTGYSGRTALFEILEATPEVKELILKSPSSTEIAKLARSQGSKSLFEDGLMKVNAGVTTIEELLRVAPPTD